MEAMEKEDREKLRKQLLLQKKKLKIKIKRPEIIVLRSFLCNKIKLFSKKSAKDISQSASALLLLLIASSKNTSQNVIQRVSGLRISTA